MVHTACLKAGPSTSGLLTSSANGRTGSAGSLFSCFHPSPVPHVYQNPLGKKSAKDCFQKERAQQQWHLPRTPAVGKLRQKASCQLWASLERFSQTQKRDGTWLNVLAVLKGKKEPAADCAFSADFCLFLKSHSKKNHTNRCQWFTRQKILEIILRLAFLFIYIRNTV